MEGLGQQAPAYEVIHVFFSSSLPAYSSVQLVYLLLSALGLGKP